MDTRKECIDIVKKIAFNFDVSFIEGDLLDYFSTVISNEGVISFPILQEAFLILFELDDGERILIFIFIIIMMENDDYELCEELLTNLEKKGLPPCSDSQALYENILIKQLFIILHECGHIFLEKNKSKKIELYDKLCEFINESFLHGKLDDETIDMHVDTVKVLGSKSEELVRELLSNTDYTENSALFLSKSINIEETVADSIALSCLKKIYQETKSKINKDIFRKSIIEAILFVDVIHTFKVVLPLLANHNEEDFFKIIADSKSRFHVKRLRNIISLQIFGYIFGFNSLDDFDINLDKYYNPFIYITETDDKAKYLYAWISGNKNITNQSTRDVLLKRIMNYVDTLKELYQKDDKT